MRSAARLTLVFCAVAVLALVVTAFAQRTSQAFTLGVNPAIPAIELQPREAGCQGPITVPPGADFDRVGFFLGTYFGTGPEVEVQVRSLPAHRVLARGTLPAGYPDLNDAGEHVVRVGHVPTDSRVEVCIVDLGAKHVAVYGNSDAAALNQAVTVDGRPTNRDITLRFHRPARSMASLWDDMASRAALFKPAWTGAWTFWLLGLLVLVAVPALLVRAVRSVED
jgi:hypothetical protein